MCHFDRFLSIRKSPGNTVIDVDISVSAKAAREVTVRTTDIFSLLRYSDGISSQDFRSNDVLWCIFFLKVMRAFETFYIQGV